MKNTKMLKIIIIISCIVVAGIVGTVVVLNMNSSNKNEKTTIQAKGEEQKNYIETSSGEKVYVGDYIAYDEGKGNSYVYIAKADEANKNKKEEDKEEDKEIKYETDGTLKWRVLSIDNGQIELICDEGIYEEEYIQSKGFIEKLDEICAIYGKGNGAESARSISADDINKYIEFEEINDGEKGNIAELNKNYCKPDYHMSDKSTEYDMLFRNSEGLQKEYIIKPIEKEEEKQDENVIKKDDPIYYYGRLYANNILAGSMVAADYSIRELPEYNCQSVMPVVTLDSNVKITGKDKNGAWQIEGTNKKYKEEKYTEISSADDFLKLMDGTSNLEDNYKLTKDIDLSGKSVKEIVGFKGILDGNGHKISGYKLMVKSDGVHGMFTELEGATIKNLKLDNAILALDGQTNDEWKETYAAILIGKATNTNVLNCEIDGKVIARTGPSKGFWFTGVVAANLKGGNLKNVNVTAKVEMKDIESTEASGFIIKTDGTYISECTADVDMGISGGQYIAANGFMYDCDDSCVNKCHAKGEINLNTTKGGSAYAFMNSVGKQSSILSSYSNVNITTTGDVTYCFCSYKESLLGITIIRDCYYEGTVKAEKSARDTTWFMGKQLGIYVKNCYLNAEYTNKKGTKQILKKAPEEAKFAVSDITEATEEEMNTKDSFEGYNFDYVWKWDENKNKPVLIYE